MQSVLPRLICVSLGLALLLAGCTRHATRPEAPGGQPPAASGAAPTQAPTGTTGQAPHTGRSATGKAPAQAAALPDSTGIPACDSYLASYVACHRAAAIYKPDEIQGRYEAMRTSLLRDSQDPQIRPQLAARCNSLASQLRQALHGKSCEGGAPAPSGTTP
ncbi:hypothetical protein [Fulvimonas yonginensis]|uniref:Lipoprotein n=1 Tax=Fulvimonas yonginensis TaxID=1495200 RepID=A0ABU8J9E5_9GAMM